MGAHAKLSPSNHRWAHCPGSVREEAGYPDTAGEAAIDGTGSHLLLEMCLKEGKEAHSYVGQTIGEGDEEKPLGWFVDEDRAVRVQQCLDYVEYRIGQLAERFPEADPILVEAESRSYPGRVVKPEVTDWWGTCDITITVKTKGVAVYIEVVDYKDGRGFVSAQDNSQLWSYLIGKAYGPRLSSLQARMVIVQPKTNPPVRYSEEVGTTEIGNKAQELAAAARATEDPEAPVKAGSWCGWCKANVKRGGHCTATLKGEGTMTDLIVTDKSLAQAVDVVGDLANATPEALAQVLELDKKVSDIAKLVKEEALRRLNLGQSIPGYHLGDGPAKRVWTSDEDAVAALKKAKLKQDEYAPRTLLTVAQAEKLLGKGAFEKVESAVTSVAGNKILKKGEPKKETKQVVDLFADVPTKTLKFF